MADIKKALEDIKNALLGRDVRSSIHDGIDAINKEVENTTGRQVDLENTFDQLVINSGNSNAEIVDARVKSDGTSYSKLGDRLNEVDSQLAHIEDEYLKKIELKNGDFLVSANIANPTFVLNQEEMIDPEKIYLLDGYLWANMKVKVSEGGVVPNFTNQISVSKEVVNSSTIYNGCGYKAGYRLNSSALEKELDNCSITGFISCKQGDVFRLSAGLYPVSADASINTHFYDSNGNSTGIFTPSTVQKGTSLLQNAQIIDNELRQFTLNVDCAYIRFSANSIMDENSIITINEEMEYITVEATYAYSWVNTGIPYNEITELETSVSEHEKRITVLENASPTTKEETPPEYWIDTIESKCKTVKEIQKISGKNAVSFVWASDTHIPDNNGGRTDDLGKIMNSIMNKCEIPFSVISGDIYSQSSASSEELLVSYEEQLPVHLFPLWGTARLLMCVGNHDGVYGQDDLDGDGTKEHYRKQLPPERIWQTYFRGQSLDFRRVFSDDGSYFYIDNTTQKTRFIMLNSQFGGEYSEDEFGYAVNNRFATSCYGQSQLDWLADVALDMPEGYSAVIVTHVPVRDNYSEYTKDYHLLKGIITAYCNKTTYSGSITDGVDGWTNSSISKNFTTAKGEIIAVFSGHAHVDLIETTSLPCPVIQITTAGGDVRDKNSDGTLKYPRTKRSDTETALDVVTIDKASRKIYCTRVGAGIDREINY